MVGEDLLHLRPEGPVKPEPFGTHRILGEEKSAVGEEPSQDLPLLRAEGLKLILSRHVKEGIEEEIRVGKGCYPPLLQAVDAGPQLQLFDDGLHVLGVGVPFSTPIFELGKEEMGKGGTQKGFRSREKKNGAKTQNKQ